MGRARHYPIMIENGLAHFVCYAAQCPLLTNPIIRRLSDGYIRYIHTAVAHGGMLYKTQYVMPARLRRIGKGGEEEEGGERTARCHWVV